MKKNILLFFAVACTVFSAIAGGSDRINYGDFNQWVVREIKESAVIGGNQKIIYEIGPNRTIKGNIPYSNMGGSPWATSNVMAKVMGVTKGSNAVFRDIRAAGNYCAKLTTIMEEVKALGMIHMKVLVSGSIFLGHIFEPITSTSNPYSKMEMGIPFSRRPRYLVFDYKLYAPGGNRIYSSGFGSAKTMAGHDSAEVYILLQRRWEDAKGNIHARRVGTGRERLSSSTSGWVDNHKIPVLYGDITHHPGYRSFMGLIPVDKSYYARNSKGKMVPVREEGWDAPGATPTHILVMASSGCGTAYVGTPGMALWIDNMELEY